MKVEKNGNTYEIKTMKDVEYLIEWKSMKAQEILEAAGPEVVSIFTDIIDELFTERSRLRFRIDVLECDLEGAKAIEGDLRHEIDDLEAQAQEDKKDFERRIDELEERIEDLSFELETHGLGRNYT